MCIRDRCKGFHFQSLHRLGAMVVDMVVSDQMQRPVDDQMGRMIGD